MQYFPENGQFFRALNLLYAQKIIMKKATRLKVMTKNFQS